MDAISCSLENYILVCKTKEYRNTPRAFRTFLFRDKRLTQSSKLIWQILSDLAVFSQELKVCFSLKDIGTSIGVSKATASRCIKELETHGYIKTNLEERQYDERTSIWVRFPSEFVAEILNAPDRAPSSKNNQADIYKATISQSNSNLSNSSENRYNQYDYFSRHNSGWTAKDNFCSYKTSCEENNSVNQNHQKKAIPCFENTTPVACMNQAVSKMEHINTNNNTMDQNTKKTINNDPVKEDTPHTLVSVHCSFLQFQKKKTELEGALQGKELLVAALASFSEQERQLILHFEKTQARLFSGKSLDVSFAMKAKEAYKKLFDEGKKLGKSPMESGKYAHEKMTAEQITATEKLFELEYALGDLNRFSKKIPTQDGMLSHERPKNCIEKTKETIKKFDDSRVALTGKQQEILKKRLKRIYERGELKGDAAKTEIRVLTEQLIYHAEHWIPQNVPHRALEERVAIAINVALKQMKAGGWTAPYGWAQEESLRIERKATQWHGKPKGLFRFGSSPQLCSAYV